MAWTQRIFALLMAAGMVIFLGSIALQRHAYTLLFFVIGLFVLYLGVNAWIWRRMRS